MPKRLSPAALPGLGSWLRPFPLFGLAAVALWAFWATYYYGRIGFMSLDMPITWDTAWRMMHGQVPCRDFNTPGDVVPALLQIPFFWLFGPTWKGYLIHAGLCNAAFSLGVALFLSRMGAPAVVALFAGAMEGWHFNTPIGIPYYDQYSYFFAFFALAATALGVLEAKPGVRAFWLACVPPLFAATVLSKVSPGLYAMALLPGVFLVGSRKGERLMALKVLAISTLATGAVLVLACLVEGIAFSRMWESLFGLPAGIGHERWESLTRAEMIERAVWYFRRMRLLWVAVPVGVAAACFAAADGWGNKGRRIGVLVWIAVAAPVVDWAAIVLANQESLNYLAYGVLAAGAGLTAAAVMITVPVPSAGVVRAGYAAAVGMTVLLGVSVDWAVRWKMTHRDVNNLLLQKDEDWSAYPRAGRELAPMIWINSYGHYSAGEFWQVVDFLREKNEPFFVAGPNALPYAFCGRVNPFPAAWLHAGLTIPKKADPRRAAFDAWAVGRIRAAGVRWLAVDPTLVDWLEELPWLKAWAEKPTGPEVDFGSWRLIPVDPDALEAVP